MVETSDRLSTGSLCRRSEREEPLSIELLPPSPLLRGVPVAAVMLAVTLAGGAYLMTQPGSSRFDNAPAAAPSRATEGLQKLIVDAGSFPGAIGTVEKRLVLDAPHVFNQMALAPDEEARLKGAVEKDAVRIGAITLWDNVNEDGDAVIVEGAGYRRELFITHKPDTFFVPYMPGGSVLITGAKDGGGGITLGVQTSLGEQSFPPLSPGQVMELQIP